MAERFIKIYDNVRNQVGLEAAYLYGVLESYEKYFKKRKMLDKEGYFFATSSEIEKRTGFSRNTQYKYLLTLEKAHLISFKMGKFPKKRMFKIE